MTINWKPKGYRVVIKPKDVEEVDEKSGIILKTRVDNLDKAKEIVGVVLAVSDMAWQWTDSKEPWAKVGDTVAFVQYSGKVLEDPKTGETYTIINDENIVAVLDDE